MSWEVRHRAAYETSPNLPPFSIGGIFQRYRTTSRQIRDIRTVPNYAAAVLNLKSFPREINLRTRGPRAPRPRTLPFLMETQYSRPGSHWLGTTPTWAMPRLSFSVFPLPAGPIIELAVPKLPRFSISPSTVIERLRRIDVRTWQPEQKLMTAALLAGLFSISVNTVARWISPTDEKLYAAAPVTMQSPLPEQSFTSQIAQSPLQSAIDQITEIFSEEGRRRIAAEGFTTFDLHPLDPISQDLRGSSLESLPATVRYFEQHRPPKNWLDELPRADALSGIYSDKAENWLDASGRPLRIEDGFVVIKIPARMAPMYEYVEKTYGISRYVLMSVATIESKQALTERSHTNCQGWGHFCPGTIRLFQGKNLLPQPFDPFDPYDGIAGIAVHLRVSSMGVRAYAELMNQIAESENPEWPVFWAGETPDYDLFEQHSWKYPIIPATWGYNRSAFYGYSVAKLAKFYQTHDQLR